MRKLYTAFARYDSYDEYGCDSGRVVYITDTLADAERQMAEWTEGYTGVDEDGNEYAWRIRRGGTDEWTSWRELESTCHLATEWRCAPHLDFATLPGYFGEPIEHPVPW